MNISVENSALSFKSRQDLLKMVFIKSGISVLDGEFFDGTFMRYKLKLDNRLISLNILIKNIVNSGWIEKPYIKRIQIKSLLNVEVPKNTNESCTMLVGVALVNSKPILVVWNPFMYTYHNTNRSCYVNVESLAKCWRDGFLKTIDAKQNILLSDEENFGVLIKRYIDDNSIE